MSEKELAKHFIDFFKDKEVFQEVPTYGCVCDFMVLDGNDILAVEVKKSFSFDVMEQAKRNKRFAHYSYIAVPQIKKGRGFQIELCKLLGIGVIMYNPKARYDKVQIVLKAEFNKKIRKPKFKEWQKDNVAGSQSGRITPFGYFVSTMKEQLKKFPDGLDARDLYDSLDKHYKKYESFRGSILGYIKRGVIVDVVFENNKFKYIGN